MNNDGQTQSREWLYALAASKLSKGETRGERPSLVEIEQWRLGGLLQERADEVLSYVAHDEQCFGQWQDLCAEQRWLDQEERQEPLQDQPAAASEPVVTQEHWLSGAVARISRGIKPVWGGAIAAGLLALLLVPAMFRPADDNVAQAYLQQLSSAEKLMGAEFPPVLARQTKSVQPLDDLANNPEQRQFRQGLAAAASRVSDITDERWQAWRTSLPAPVSCDGQRDGDCSAQAVQNQALGSWSLVTALACQNNATSADFWPSQANSLTELLSVELPQGHFLARRLQQPLPTAKPSLCQLATGLLGQGG